MTQCEDVTIIVGVDDTDTTQGVTGTGRLTTELASLLDDAGWTRSRPVTRHQLFVHPKIPYTSHNSAMAFSAKTSSNQVSSIVDFATRFLERRSEEGSDPGFCLAVITKPDEWPYAREQGGRLVEFGYRAKREVLDKCQAYKLGEELGLHLSEHGGTGMGVIGALAAVGLRMSGNDGRFRGHLTMSQEMLSIGEICAYGTVDLVRSTDGDILDHSEMVRIGPKAKSILWGGRAVLLVTRQKDPAGTNYWQTVSKQYMKEMS